MKTKLNRLNKRIPISLFNQFFKVAQMFGKLDLECRGDFYFNHDTQEFHLHIPRQTCHRLWVNNDEKDGEFVAKMLEEKDQYIELVCEIHSHHSMYPIPSATDNASERMPGMSYVIVGLTNTNNPQVTQRIFTDQYIHEEVAFESLFSEPFVFESANNEMLPYLCANWFTIKK